MQTSPRNRPDSTRDVAVAERRRHRRRELRLPTDVTVFGEGRNDDWEAPAVMLNASPDGIACRVADADAARIVVGRFVRVLFRIGDENQPFDRRARVVSSIESGTPGSRLIGLEFCPDDDQPAERKRLMNALAAACLS